MRRVHVAVGVVLNERREILISKRPDDSHQGGLWEFPGGKVEAGEDVRQALARELDEELGIVAAGLQPLVEIEHDYPDLAVLLDVWWVTQFSGEPHGREGQPLCWVRADQLSDYVFPAANEPITHAVVRALNGTDHTAL